MGTSKEELSAHNIEGMWKNSRIEKKMYNLLPQNAVVRK
jgi:hypothetical protein